MKILITGIGNTGKSTFRRLLVNKLEKLGLPVRHYDTDRLEESNEKFLRVLPRDFRKDFIYIIEDIHAPLAKSALLPLESYDLIIYLKPRLFSHLVFWLKRGFSWWKQGLWAWEPEKGWKGDGKPFRSGHIFPIFKVLFFELKNRKRWISEDLKKISRSQHLIVQSQWTIKGIKFKICLS